MRRDEFPNLLSLPPLQAPLSSHRRTPALAPRHLARRAVRVAHVTQARVESATLSVGWKAPDFELLEPLTGKTVRLSDHAAGAKATLIMVLSNHCPFVIHLKPAIAELAKEYGAKGVSVIALSANDPKQKEGRDGPERMAEDAAKNGYPFPYVFDATQEVAKKYNAMCTPEFMVFDANMGLQYHGQFDSTRPSSKGGDGRPVTGEDLRAALDAVLAGKPAPTPWKPSIGCSVKWVPGNEPSWYG